MNEERVKKLAQEGHVEFSRRVFRRIIREDGEMQALAAAIPKGEIDGEGVFAEPDFTFSVRLPKARKAKLVCVQTPDGKCVRVVGLMKPSAKEK